MKKWLLTILFGTALVLGACGGGDDDASEEPADDADTEETEGGSVDTAAAEEVFKKSCASCHGGDLSGGAGPALDKVGTDHSADDIADIIDNGQGGMPAQNLEEDDRDLVAAWLADMK